jgi:hypothetical protein
MLGICTAGEVLFEMSDGVLHGDFVPAFAMSEHGWSDVILLGEDKIRL